MGPWLIKPTRAFSTRLLKPANKDHNEKQFCTFHSNHTDFLSTFREIWQTQKEAEKLKVRTPASTRSERTSSW